MKFVAVLLAVLAAGTVLWLMWPVMVRGFVPILVERGWVPEHIPWLACVFLKYQLLSVLGTELYPMRVVLEDTDL